jgi:uncharacterized protein (TIGR03085 family)
MTTLARAERLELCDLLERVGPDAPTLCAGWTTYDLLAHLVARDRRPDHAAAPIIRPLAGHADRVRLATKRTPYPQLISRLRQGPPAPFRVAFIDAGMNTTEYFVHHEDVLRAQPDWTPRTLDQSAQDALWKPLVGMVRLLVRRSPVGLSLTRTDGERRYATVVVKRAVPDVTVIGEVSELTLFLFGRSSVARVEFSGDDDAVMRLKATKFTL